MSGLSAAIMYFLPPILANAWFPSNQVATAAAIPVTAMCAGGVVVPIVFSNVLPKADMNVTVDNETLNSTIEIDDFDRLQNVFIICMAIYVAFSVMSIALFCGYAQNHPPTPPSGAQAQLLRTRKDSAHPTSDLRENFRTLLLILKLRSFWNIVVVTALNSTTLAFTLYLQPAMLKATFESASNAVAGYCLLLGTITAACGTVVSGKILDKWHEYKKFCFLGNIYTNIYL